MGSGGQSVGLAAFLRPGYEGVREPWALEELGKQSPMKMAAGHHTCADLPLEDLLGLYGYDVSGPLLQQDRQPSQLADMTLDKDQISRDLFPDEHAEEPPADDLTPSVTSHPSDLLRRHILASPRSAADLEPSTSSDEGSEEGSAPSSDGRKDIMVGSQYQAKIPPLNPWTYQERAYDGEDQLLWSPDVLSGSAVEDFLLCSQRRGPPPRGPDDTPLPGYSIRDNEQALYELVKCNYNAEEALTRLRFNVKVFSEELCAWSEEECRNFEHGYRVHGKNFHLIQANKVRTRSVGECVEYYYMWKKSDRHEFFTQQTTKLGRRKFSLHSGNTEDEEQDGEGGELEGGVNSHCSPPARQTEPPSPRPDLDQPEQEGRPRRRRTPRFLLKP